MLHHKNKFTSNRTKWFPVIIIICMCCFPTYTQAQSCPELSSGETVYVSIYSNVYAGPKEVQLELASMLVVRNTDPKYPISVSTADYYDTKGKRIDRYVTKPLKLNPLESIYFYLKEYDKRGGPGANFIVRWKADRKVNQPIIEGVMYGARQGLSFISSGQILREHTQQ